MLTNCLTRKLYWLLPALLFIEATVWMPLSHGEEIDRKPENWFVAVSEAQVYSGPSKEYYPTGQLSSGTAVEVYHRTDSGWAALRPPSGSFSWVVARDAYLLPGGKVIEITSDKAVSWIGTSLGSAKQYRWQVELRPGEQLGILGEKTTSDKDGRETLWYKIAPPSGEFRWIEVSALSATKPEVRTKENVAGRTSATEKKPAVRQASAKRKADGKASSQNVVSAQSEEYIVLDGAEEVGNGGEVIVEDEYYDGEVIQEDGSYAVEQYDGSEIVDGEIIVEGDEGYEVAMEQAQTAPSDRWGGWHIIEITDDGMRFPLFSRFASRSSNAIQHDPKNYDPYDLSMNNSPSPPRAIRETIREDVGVSPAIRSSVRSTPWRDPRDLRRKRELGLTGGEYMPSEYDQGRSILEGFSSNSQSIPSNRISSRDSNSPQAIGGTSNGNGYTAGNSSTTSGNPVDSVRWHGVSSRAPQSTVRSTYSPNAHQSSTAQPTAFPGYTDINQLQLALNDIVAKPVETWNLKPIAESTRQFIEHGSDAVQRGQARLLLERIEAFERVAVQSGFGSNVQVAMGSPSIGGVNTANYGAVGSSDSSVTSASYAAPSFDATGWLVPVHAASLGQPSHALTDDAGQTIAFVTAIPGLNLDRFVNQQVGIQGLRGYLPEFRSGHIQASRITRLR